MGLIFPHDSASYNKLVLATQSDYLTRHWPLDDLDENVARELVKRVTNTLTNVTFGATNFLNGDRALSLPGTYANGICEASNADLDVGAGDFTVMAWVNTDTSSGDANVVFIHGRMYANGKRYMMLLNTSGLIELEIDDDSTKKTLQLTTSVDGQGWIQLIMVKDGNNLRGYYNGSEHADSPLDISAVGNLDNGAKNDTYIGTGRANDAPENYSYPYDGYLSKTAVWIGIALTPTEILRLYKGVA